MSNSIESRLVRFSVNRLAHVDGSRGDTFMGNGRSQSKRDPCRERLLLIQLASSKFASRSVVVVGAGRMGRTVRDDASQTAAAAASRRSMAMEDMDANFF
jgi:hypothetical protein